MIKRIKDIIANLKARYEYKECERWCVRYKNEILVTGVEGNEWKLKQLDKKRAQVTGLYFPIGSTTDEEYAALVCMSALDVPWFSPKAKLGAMKYLASKGYVAEKDIYDNVVYRNVKKRA